MRWYSWPCSASLPRERRESVELGAWFPTLDLTEAERETWRAVWAEIGDLLKKAEGDRP